MEDIRRQLLAAFDAEHRDHVAAIRRELAAAAAGRHADVRDVFRRAHSLKGAARAVDLPAVEAIAHDLEALLTRIEAGDAALDAAAIATIEAGLDAIEAAAAPESVAPEAEPATDAPAALLRVSAANLDQLAQGVRALATELQAQASFGDAIGAIAADLRAARRGVTGDAAAAIDRALRAATALAAAQARSEWSVDRALDLVQRDAERILLVPVDSVFDGFGRMVRELARDQGKDVDLVAIGGDAEADRRVLQALKDPVMHALRNAVGHGIEPRGQRVAAGKSDRGVVTLETIVADGRLTVSIRDDGRGLDFARIDAEARRRGLVDGATPLGTDQLAALLFEAGFSTAREVDRVSGRGVGLSVVGEALRRLGGSAVARPLAPHGTEIRLSAPLAFARQPILLVEAGGQCFGLPTRGVDRLLRLSHADVTTVEGAPSVLVDDRDARRPVPLVPLAALLGIDGAPAIGEALLLRHGDRACLLAVDALSDVRPLVVGQADVVGADRDLVSGTVLLDDERPALVLNPQALIARWMRDNRRLASAGLGLAEPRAVERVTTILVVDDSITTRTLEKSILEAQGYRVLLSVDGVDALQRLRTDGAFVDLVVADVEMPRMDGFALLQAMRADPSLARLPVIMMTSRADDADVRRGLDLGADAYLAKQRFDQGELLATIGQLL